jgi:hypothetical protein
VPRQDAAAAPASRQGADFDDFASGDPRLPRAKHTDFLLGLFGGSVDAGFHAIAEHAAAAAS